MLSFASAGTPLVHPDSGVPDGVPPRDWEPIPLSEVRMAKPVSLPGDDVRLCVESPTSMETALEELDRAVLNAEGVEQAIEDARSAACGGATTAQLARVAFLAGVAASEEEDPSAKIWFAKARALVPQLEWDTNYAERFRPNFDTATAPTVGGVEVVPVGTIDGRSGVVDVIAGKHLVESGDVRAWVDVSAGGAVVLPSAFPSSMRWDGDLPKKAVSRLLIAKFGEGSEVGWVDSKGVWTGRAGRTDWTPLVAIPELMPPKRRRVGPKLLLGGLVLAGVGEVVAITSFQRAKGDGVDVPQHGRLKRGYRAGHALGIVGGVVGATGLVLTVSGR